VSRTVPEETQADIQKPREIPSSETKEAGFQKREFVQSENLRE